MSGVLVLLPPSETKATRPRGAAMDLGRLSFPELTPSREALLTALAEVSHRADACTVLGVPASLAPEVARNRALREAPALRVSDLYTGVLYDALGLASLDAAAARRARRMVVVISALYGALRLGDRVAGYRLSGSVHLPGIGGLGAFWRPRLAEVLPAAVGEGLVVDARSATYVAAWRPSHDLADRWVAVTVRGVSHQAKHTRGLVARELCATSTRVRDPRDLLDVIPHLSPTLEPPRGRGKPWVLSVGASSH